MLTADYPATVLTIPREAGISVERSHPHRTRDRGKANPDGFGYTWFCTTFEAWKKRARPSMRQTHVGGEKVFVDFAGDAIDIFDPITGEAYPQRRGTSLRSDEGPVRAQKR